MFITLILDIDISNINKGLCLIHFNGEYKNGL